MFVINEDKSISVTRGDTVALSVVATDKETPYRFQAGDIVRIKVFGKKDVETVYIEEDVCVGAETEFVDIVLTGEHTSKNFDWINKPTDFWYEIELNPDSEHPQTIIGYDEDGAKIFRLFPEGKDVPSVPVEPEDIPIVDKELDISSSRPVENKAIAKAFVIVRAEGKELSDRVNEVDVRLTASISELETDVAMNKTRINAISKLEEGSTTGDAELTDIRVGYDGATYSSASESVRNQIKDIHNLINDNRNLLKGVHFANGKLDGNGGVTTAGANVKVSDLIPIKPNITYTIGCTYGESPICFYDSEGHILPLLWKAGQLLKITTPDNAAYVRFVFNDVSKNQPYKWMVEGEVDVAPNDIGFVTIKDVLIDGDDIRPETIKNEQIAFSSIDYDKLSFVEGNKDYLSGATYEMGKNIDNYGFVKDYAYTGLTDKIYLEQGETYYVTLRTGVSFAIVGFGLDDMVYNHTSSDIVVESNMFTVPYGCYYVRCAIQTDYIGNVHIYKASADMTTLETFRMPKLRVTPNNIVYERVIGEGRIVSKPTEERVAHASNIVSDQFNDYICYYASATANGEDINSDFAVKLTRQSKFDKCDKETRVVLAKGEQVGDFTQSTVYSPYDPNLLIVGYNIRVWMILSDANKQDEKLFGFRDVSTTGLGNTITRCKLKYSANGTNYTVDMNEREMCLFEDRIRGVAEGTHNITFAPTLSHINKINGKLFTILTMSTTTDSVVAILSSNDNGVTWNVDKVLDSSFDALRPSEAGWDVIGNTMYIALRCDNNNVNYVPVLTYDISTGVTSDVIKLNEGLMVIDYGKIEAKSRVWVTCSDGNVYVCSNILPHFKEAERSRVRITKLNESLEELNYVDIVNPCGCSYFSLIESGGRYSMLYTEDYRMQIAKCKGDIAISDVTQYIVGLDV
jgi:hypothetical protein